MNDFTKEQLRWLITLCDNNNSGFIKFNHPLYVKLQSLIDNYCEHEYAIPNFGILQHCSTCKTLVKGNLMEDSDNHEHDMTCRIGRLSDE